jgi:hypothetical protein
MAQAVCWIVGAIVAAYILYPVLVAMMPFASSTRFGFGTRGGQVFLVPFLRTRTLGKGEVESFSRYAAANYHGENAYRPG